MKITHLHIENFRSIRSLDLTLDDTTVFIGPNNAGKSAILEAVRIALSRRWGQQGTGFSDNDVHCADENTDPRTAPAVKIGIVLDEPATQAWPSDMVADLEEVTAMMPSGLNRIALNVTYSWNAESKSFEPSWEFLDAAGQALQGRRRSINTSAFFNYLLFFWLGPLRDADDEFTPRSRYWGGLLRSIQIPTDLEAEIKSTLDGLDVKLLQADPRFVEISDTVGRATEIAAGERPGAAKLRMLPLNTRDLVSRAGIVLRNEGARPWLPLDHHGQGLQSLSVIFLFQAAVMQRLAQELQGAEAVFAIEEPEVHLHPHAARTLWNRIAVLPGQKLVTTHSPYFVQNVPLHYLRLVRCSAGSTQISWLPKKVVSDLPWNADAEALISGRHLAQFTKDTVTGCIASNAPIDESLAGDLVTCLRQSVTLTSVKDKVDAFRHACRVLVSEAEESELSFLGRRMRGEIFFAREWILIEGQSEYLLMHAIGRGLGYDLDQHGISVIDFQNNGNPGIYAALADAFHIPWHMVTDGDEESKKFRAQITKRGYIDAELTDRFATLVPPNNLEGQLIADGHEGLLRTILSQLGVSSASTCSVPDLKKMLNKHKTEYVTSLALTISADAQLAARMPAPLVSVVKDLKAKYDARST